MLAVKTPAELIVPVPVVETLPVVDKVPDELIDQVAPPTNAKVVPTVLLPTVITFAFAPVPRLTAPVVPESKVRVPVVVVAIESAPESVSV